MGEGPACEIRREFKCCTLLCLALSSSIPYSPPCEQGALSVIGIPVGQDGQQSYSHPTTDATTCSMKTLLLFGVQQMYGRTQWYYIPGIIILIPTMIILFKDPYQGLKCCPLWTLTCGSYYIFAAVILEARLIICCNLDGLVNNSCRLMIPQRASIEAQVARKSSPASGRAGTGHVP